MSLADENAEVVGTPQQRREDRARVELEGPTLRTASGTREAVTLHDLSSKGFRTDWPHQLVPGDRVWLKLPGREEMPASVAWELDRMIGCKFDVALHSAVFASIINRRR